MLLRGITIAAVAAAVACASASPRRVEAPGDGSLVVGVMNSLQAGPDVHTVNLSLEGDLVALIESSGSGEDRTPALEADETRVFTQQVPGGGHVCLEVTAHIGQQQIAQEQAELRAGQIQSLGDKYYAAIQSQVTNNWFRPPTARSGLRCTLKIVQIPGGEVISAAIAGKCNADEATRRSLVAAVERAGSLPYRGFEDVFEREIDFIFTYDDD